MRRIVDHFPDVTLWVQFRQIDKVPWKKILTTLPLALLVRNAKKTTNSIWSSNSVNETQNQTCCSAHIILADEISEN